MPSVYAPNVAELWQGEIFYRVFSFGKKIENVAPFPGFIWRGYSRPEG